MESVTQKRPLETPAAADAAATAEVAATLKKQIDAKEADVKKQLAAGAPAESLEPLKAEAVELRQQYQQVPPELLFRLRGSTRRLPVQSTTATSARECDQSKIR